MAEPMSAERLREIRERLEKATQGPWRVDELESPAPILWLSFSPYYEPNHWPHIEPANATLIAHAPTDLADLLAEVERLRAELAEQERRDAEQRSVL